MSRRNRSNSALRQAATAGLEQLEKRVLFSAINWTNKGTTLVDSDGFNANYGANATLARNIVQRAIDDWERVIPNFNGFGGRNTFSLDLSAGPLGPTTFASTSGVTFDLAFKPDSADITLDDNAAGDGWYFDATPGTATLPEDSDFTAFISPFAADRPTSSGRDLYRTTAHEIGHALGLIGTSFLLTSRETDVGDDPLSGNAADRLMGVDVNGDNVTDYTLTTNGGRHLFEGGGTYTGPVHPNDIDNPGRAVSSLQVRRGLISDTDATLLRDVYGYTITLPSTINTFYVQYNQGANSVTVNGDMNPSGSLRDVIDLEVSGTAMRFEVNGTSETIEGVNFGGIIVNAGEGNDDIDVDNVLASKSVIVNGEEGNDFIQLSRVTGDIDNDILSNLTVNGGAGTDTIQANDTSDPVGADTYTITAPSITFGSRVLSYSLTESIDLLGSRNATVYNIDSTVPGCTISILSSGFADDFFVGDGDYDGHIFGDVDIDGQNGQDFLHIEDGSDTGAGTYTLTSSAFHKTSGGTLSLDSVEKTFIDGSNQASTYNVDLFNSTMSADISAGGGNDTLDVDGSTNDIDNGMLADITFDGQGGTDKLDLDDSGDSADAESYELTGISFTKSSASGTLNYFATEQVDLRGNDGNNTITVQYGNLLDTEQVTVGGGGGNDVITSLVPGAVSLLLAPVTLTGGPGTDTITIDDSAGSIANSYTLTSNTLQMDGTVRPSGLITYTAENFDLATTSLAATIRVSSTAAGTNYTIDGENGDDTFEIGTAGVADGIVGPLTISGDGGNDVVTYHDGNNTASHTYTVTSSSVARDGAATVNYDGMESLTVDAGTLGDTIAVNSTFATTPVTVNGNGGPDVFTVGGGDWDSNVLGSVTVNGGAGTNDSLRIDDTLDSIVPADDYTVSDVQTTKTLVASAINYATIESYTLDANGSGSTITINNSFAGPFRINANGGADTINLVNNANSSFVTLDGGAGLDTVNVNSDAVGTATAHFDTTQDLASLSLLAGGTAVLEANGSRVIDTDALTCAATGKLDLTDNDLIVDYTVASQLSAVQSLINLARNGGAWNGVRGITSSSAAANAQHNTTLGAMEASDFKSIYGAAATFDGRAIDNTAVLVKYTYYGDADFNGKVNFDDYVRIDSGFNNHRSGWMNGDFDGNGSINFDDYVLIDLAFNTQSGTLHRSGRGGMNDVVI